MTIPVATAIRRAMAAGINWIDTAPSYGQGRSEEALGWLLPEIEEQPYLSTKVFVDLIAAEDIASQVNRSIEASLKRLGRDERGCGVPAQFPRPRSRWPQYLAGAVAWAQMARPMRWTACAIRA